MIINFLLYLSWVLLPVCVLWACMCIYFSIKYKDSLDEIKDRMRGVTRTFPFKLPMLLALLSAVYLLTYYGQ